MMKANQPEAKSSVMMKANQPEAKSTVMMKANQPEAKSSVMMKANQPEAKSTVMMKANQPEAKSSVMMKANQPEAKSSVMMKANRPEAKSSVMMKANQPDAKSSVMMKANQPEVKSSDIMKANQPDAKSSVKMKSNQADESNESAPKSWLMPLLHKPDSKSSDVKKSNDSSPDPVSLDLPESNETDPNAISLLNQADYKALVMSVMNQSDFKSLLMPNLNQGNSKSSSVVESSKTKSDSMKEVGPTRSFICNQCGVSYKSQNSLDSHKTYSCGKESVHACTECSYKGSKRGNLKAHMIEKHDLYLSMDNKITKIKKKPSTTKKVVDTTKPFVCNQCGRSYTTRSNLNYHQNHICGKGPSQTCTECPYKTWKRGNLKSHLRARHNLYLSIDNTTKTIQKKPSTSGEPKSIAVLITKLKCKTSQNVEVSSDMKYADRIQDHAKYHS
ncbi:hypothetical protein WDU94_005918 [Cyamophila willieti]